MRMQQYRLSYRAQQAKRLSKQIGRLLFFLDVAGIHQRLAGSRSDADDLNAQSLERLHLPLDEGVRDSRILIDQV
ncbi:hypothetical protein MTX20_28695 [Bradyrhizobium sp. ISRA435]|nr:hypothetical protein MTX20_28695 [Bradyrhizobium sp. ISRA435]